MSARPPSILLALLLLLAIGAAFTLGLPLPTTDDLFFYGAPIQIAQGGGLENPPLRGFLEGLGTTAYFCHVPLHPWALGLWLKLWGVSSAAILAFVWTVYAIGAAGLEILLRRLRWALPERLLLLLVYLTLHLVSASRPDGLALALALSGGAVLSFDHRGRFFAGSLLLGFGVLAYPMAALWGLLAAALNWLGTLPAQRRPWSAFALPFAAAAIICAALFWWMLDGRLAEWLRVFQWVRAERGRPLWLMAQLVAEFLAAPRRDVLLVPVLFCLPVSLLLAWRWRQRLPAQTLPTVALALLTSLGCALLYFAHSSMQTSILCGFLAAGAVITATGSRLALAGLTGVYLCTFSLWWLQAGFRQEPPAAERAAARAAAARAVAEKRALRIDSASARYAFDFRLPPEAYDVIYSTTARPYAPPFAQREAAGETWILARSWIRFLNRAPAAAQEYPRVTIRGRAIDPLPLHPFEIVVLAP